MNKLKHRQASVKLNNNSVVVYYSLRGKEMRYPTGISLPKVKDKNGRNPYYWDYKNNKLKLPPFLASQQNEVDGLAIKQKVIDEMLVRANTYLNDHFTRDVELDPEELYSLLGSQQDIKYQKANTALLEFFNDFIEKKRSHFTARGNIISLKDYVSTKLLLEDFQAYKSNKLKVHNICNLWLEELVQFCSIPHADYYGEHKVSSKGDMADSTIKKRLDIVAEFFAYLKELKVVSENEVEIIKKFKKTIKKQPSHKETLDIPEIHKLYKFKFKNKNREVVRDLFVFLCFTGIRYQDLYDFDCHFITKAKVGEGYIYIKAANKTGIDYHIPLTKIVMEILEKYNYNLPKISGQYGNRTIKEALKETQLFNDYTQI